jgi:hypothetical protein
MFAMTETRMRADMADRAKKAKAKWTKMSRMSTRTAVGSRMLAR